MYEGLTSEQLIEKLTERDTLIATMQADAKAADEKRASTLGDHEAEIGSLKKELEELHTKLHTQAEELKKTKELNFTLGRQVARDGDIVDTEQALHNIFGSSERKE